MISLWRGNSFTEIHGAPPEALQMLKLHLSVQIDDPSKIKSGETRYNHIFQAPDPITGEKTLWATLLHKNVVPAGLTGHVVSLLKHYGWHGSIRDIRTPPVEQLPLWSVSTPPRQYQDWIHQEIIKHGVGVIDAPPRCIDGNVKVQVSRGGKTFTLRIADLATRFRNQAWWDQRIPTMIRATDPAGYIRLFPIAKVWVSGTKPLLRLTTETGREIQASADHLVLTITGWRALGTIGEGDLILEEAPRGAAKTSKRKSYPFRSNLYHHPFAGRRGRKPEKGAYCVGVHRLVVEAQLNGMGLEVFVQRVRSGAIDGLVFLDPSKYTVHHKDEDHKNNTLANLEVVDRLEHYRMHGKDGGWKHVTRRVHPVRVEKISRAPAAMTYDIQVPGAENFLANGIVVHNSGKTFMMARAIDTFNQRSLVVAPSLAIVKQTYDVFCKIFGTALVGRVDGQVAKEDRDLTKPIVIATIASAIRLPQSYFDGLALLAIDEFHHGAAESYHKLNALARNIYYRLCFTGTHFRTAEDRLAMEAICADVLYQIPVRYLVDEKFLAPPRYVVAMPDTPRLSVRKWAEVYEQGITKNKARNKMIAKIASTLGVESNIPTIVLVRRREHAKILSKMIPDSKVVMGGEDALTNQTIDDFRAGLVPVLIGTTVIGEGVDLPNAGALVYASGGGATVQQIQSYFRPLTANPGKEMGIIYDFKDIHHHTLSAHSDERMALAEACLDTRAVRLWG